jgi:hypothetical protein
VFSTSFIHLSNPFQLVFVTRRTRNLAMRIVGLALLIVGSSFPQALGTWRMNPSKSKMIGCPCPQSITLKVEASPKGEIQTIYKVGENGSSETISFILHLDGKDHELASWPPFDAVRSNRVDARTAEILLKKNGEVLLRNLRRVSPDGKLMTLEIWGSRTPGARFYRSLVLEKQ